MREIKHEYTRHIETKLLDRFQLEDFNTAFSKAEKMFEEFPREKIVYIDILGVSVRIKKRRGGDTEMRVSKKPKDIKPAETNVTANASGTVPNVPTD